MPQLGDRPIEERYRQLMQEVADLVDLMLNEKPNAPTTGFVLLVFPFETHEGRCNYISNASREDVVTMLKEQVKRFEGQPEARGRA